MWHNQGQHLGMEDRCPLGRVVQWLRAWVLGTVGILALPSCAHHYLGDLSHVISPQAFLV